RNDDPSWAPCCDWKLRQSPAADQPERDLPITDRRMTFTPDAWIWIVRRDYLHPDQGVCATACPAHFERLIVKDDRAGLLSKTRVAQTARLLDLRPWRRNFAVVLLFRTS